MTLLFQVFALAFVAWLVPTLVARAMPQTTSGLVTNGVLSSLILGALCMGWFVYLYGAAGITIWQEVRMHFVLLAGQAALVWAPVMVFTLSLQPQGWKARK